MATGGRPASDSGEERRQTLTCCVCKEIFVSPKMLPCHHTYCLPCLQGLVSRHGSGSFPCPVCRRKVEVPSGGVSAFPSNFYLLSGDLDRARNESMCDVHPNQEVDMYCADCQMAACLKCLLTKHKGHDHKDLHEEADKARRQLEKDRGLVENAVFRMTEKKGTLSRRRRIVQDKTEEVRTTIRLKLQSVMTMAKRIHDETIAELEAVSSDIDSQMSEDLDSRNSRLDQLHQLQEALKSGTDREALAVAKKMREGRGIAQAEDEPTFPNMKYMVHCPILSCKAKEEDLTPILRDFFGPVEMGLLNNPIRNFMEKVGKSFENMSRLNTRFAEHL